MNVLSIGNSFSQDAHRYLHQIAKANDVNMRTVNLYIGGCSLERHYRNMLLDEEVYKLEINGEDTGFRISLKKALLSQRWDYITLQQASPFTFNYETYQPYLAELIAYVKKCCPKAKILLHETWAYEDGSDRLHNVGYTKSTDMYRDIHRAYEQAYNDIQSDGLIRSGALMQNLINIGTIKVHRDTYHASRGIGRYAIGLLWYLVLTGKDMPECVACSLDESVTEHEIAIVKSSIREIMKCP